MRALDIFYGDSCMGTLYDSAPLTFEYAPAWMTREDAFSLSMVPLAAGRIASPWLEAFFENLLPEGELRLYLSEQRKASTLFSMLMEVAGDTAGAFLMLPRGQKPSKATYRQTTWAALAETIRKQSAAAIQTSNKHARISLAGAQDKASIGIFDGETPVVPNGSAPSTHILKPNIRRLNSVWESAANEAIVMRAAAHCGLNAASVFYEPLTQSCVVERFDRVRRDDGTLDRLIQYDFCQLTGIGSEQKYEKEGGPDIAACAQLIRRYSARAAVDLQAFARWIFFNLYVGNNDSHAKNLSIYQRPGFGIRLTPFYDMMCTRMYAGQSKEFAFRIGGKALPGQIGAAQIMGLATQLDMSPRYVRQLALALAGKMPLAIDAAVEEIAPTLTHTGRAFAAKLALEVKSITRRAVKRFDA